MNLDDVTTVTLGFDVVVAVVVDFEAGTDELFASSSSLLSASMILEMSFLHNFNSLSGKTVFGASTCELVEL